MISLQRAISEGYPHLKSAYVKAHALYTYLKDAGLSVKFDGDDSGHGAGVGGEDIDFFYDVRLRRGDVLRVIISFCYVGKKVDYYIFHIDDSSGVRMMTDAASDFRRFKTAIKEELIELRDGSRK